jgi:hypothetical protein
MAGIRTQQTPRVRSPARKRQPAEKVDNNWYALNELNIHFPSWLIPGILPRESMICLYGKRGQGKTFLALDWACSIATGQDWGGLSEAAGKAPASGKVVYLLAERPEGIKRRAAGWIRHRQVGGRPDLTESLMGETDPVFFVAQRRFAIDKVNDRTALIKKLEAIQPLLLICDPLAYFMDGSENDTRDMQKFSEGLRKIVDTCKCSVLLVHHEGKGRSDNLGARGSSALEAAMDTVIHLQAKNKSEVLKLEVTKQREAVQHPAMALEFIAIADEEANPLGKFPVIRQKVWIEPEVVPKKPLLKINDKAQSAGKKPETSSRDIVLDVVRKIDAEGKPITRVSVFEALGGRRGFSRTSCNAILTWLVGQNYLADDQGKLGHANAYVLLPQPNDVIADQPLEAAAE